MVVTAPKAEQQQQLMVLVAVLLQLVQVLLQLVLVRV